MTTTNTATAYVVPQMGPMCPAILARVGVDEAEIEEVQPGEQTCTAGSVGVSGPPLDTDLRAHCARRLGTRCESFSGAA